MWSKWTEPLLLGFAVEHTAAAAAWHSAQQGKRGEKRRGEDRKNTIEMLNNINMQNINKNK